MRKLKKKDNTIVIETECSPHVIRTHRNNVIISTERSVVIINTVDGGDGYKTIPINDPFSS